MPRKLISIAQLSKFSWAFFLSVMMYNYKIEYAARLFAFAILYHLVCGTAFPTCNSEYDCSLLGICKNNSCQCNKGWKGYSCAVADLKELNVTMGYQNKSSASWGGRPVYDKASGNWNLIVTEIKNSCPLILFEYNSMIVRATSKDARGPYIHKEIILPPFHHNPTILGPTKDGFYLLYYIGTDLPEKILNCSMKIPDVPIHPDPASNGYISLAYTKDIVNGPWNHKIVLRNNQEPLNESEKLNWKCSMNNPTAHILQNGTVVLIFRANACPPYNRPPLCKNSSCMGEKLGVAFASHFLSEYVQYPEPIVAPYIQNITSNNEDPFLWRAKDGSWHMINHQQSKGNLCGSSAEGHSCGAHFFAKDPRGPWLMSPQPVYTAHVMLSNGTNATFLTRQRPQLVFDDDMLPIQLFTSGSFEGNNPDLNILTHTYVQSFA